MSVIHAFVGLTVDQYNYCFLLNALLWILYLIQIATSGQLIVRRTEDGFSNAGRQNSNTYTMLKETYIKVPVGGLAHRAGVAFYKYSLPEFVEIECKQVNINIHIWLYTLYTARQRDR